ncbi:MAG: gamma-glutamyltransferase [Xanthomonadaceae bacterium]|nr:gamma-glutamyltransferase [Xanthomonadaceae bacterium]
MKKLYIAAFVAFAAFATGTHAAERPGHAAIASAHTLATRAGFEVLAEGGNAFDAAIAVASTLSVVEPQSSGIGGGGFFMLHRASDGKNVMLDARETAPAAVRESQYLKPDGTPNRDTALYGPLAAGIPGEPAALVWLAAHYGKLPLAKSLAPAIRIARAGFQPGQGFLDAIAGHREQIARYAGTKALLMPNGDVPKAGWTFRNPDLAATLERIAAHGDDGFYKGKTAQLMLKAVKETGGDWSAADLANYKVVEREPLSFDYRGWKIVTVAPPSSGGVALEEMFNVLSGYDLGAMDRAQRLHYIIEAMRRAFRDHNEYLGDPDFVKMPLATLLSPQYAAGLRASILPDKATPSAMLPSAVAHAPGMHTTHFSIVDADGNMVATTQTVNTHFGSCLVPPGTGVFLNNEMDDFALVPGAPNAYGLLGNKANAPAPGKRMLSSMTPTFVFGPERVGVIGSPGGSTIITQVFEGLLAFMHGDSAAQIAAKPRYHHQYLPDVVYAEPDAFDAATEKALVGMGYDIQQRGHWGFMNVVTWNLRTNKLDAASDPRHASGLGEVR